MVRQHHYLNGPEFKQTAGDSGRQRSLAGSSPRGRRVGRDRVTVAFTLLYLVSDPLYWLRPVLVSISITENASFHNFTLLYMHPAQFLSPGAPLKFLCLCHSRLPLPFSPSPALPLATFLCFGLSIHKKQFFHIQVIGFCPKDTLPIYSQDYSCFFMILFKSHFFF